MKPEDRYKLVNKWIATQTHSKYEKPRLFQRSHNFSTAEFQGSRMDPETDPRVQLLT